MLILVTIVMGILWSVFFHLSIGFYATIVGGVVSVIINLMTGITFALLVYFVISLVIDSYTILVERRKIVRSCKELNNKLRELIS